MYEDKNAVYALNSYTWKLLEANLGWTRVKDNSLVPIVPVSQQPELMQSGKAFIVYGSAIHPADHLYQLVKEAVSYTIYSTSATEVNKVVNLLTETFARQDEAAADVNDWLAIEEAGRNKSRNIHFGTVKATMSEKAEDAPNEEGGYAAGLVLVETRFTVTNSNIQTTGFNY